MKIYYTSKELLKRASEKELEELGDRYSKLAFERILTLAISSVKGEHVSGSESRKLNRILNALDDTKQEYFELKEEDALFIKSMLNDEKVKMPLSLVRLFSAILDLVDKSFVEAKSNDN